VIIIFRNVFTALAFTEPNRHNSFAPVRENQTGQWFVDGESLMSAVADAIELVWKIKKIFNYIQIK